MKKKMLLGIGIVILLPVLILGIARYIAIPIERGCCQERLHPLTNYPDLYSSISGRMLNGVSCLFCAWEEIFNITQVGVLTPDNLPQCGFAAYDGSGSWLPDAEGVPDSQIMLSRTQTQSTVHNPTH